MNENFKKDFEVLPSNMWRAFEATQEIQNSPVGTGDRWKSLPEIDQSYKKMEMGWIAEAIENDGKLTERRFFLKLLTRTVPYQKKSNQKCQLVASIWRLQKTLCQVWNESEMNENFKRSKCYRVTYEWHLKLLRKFKIHR